MAEALYENLQDLISKEEFENKKLQRLRCATNLSFQHVSDTEKKRSRLIAEGKKRMVQYEKALQKYRETWAAHQTVYCSFPGVPKVMLLEEEVDNLTAKVRELKAKIKEKARKKEESVMEVVVETPDQEMVPADVAQDGGQVEEEGGQGMEEGGQVRDGGESIEEVVEEMVIQVSTQESEVRLSTSTPSLVGATMPSPFQGPSPVNSPTAESPFEGPTPSIPTLFQNPTPSTFTSPTPAKGKEQFFTPKPQAPPPVQDVFSTPSAAEPTPEKFVTPKVTLSIIPRPRTPSGGGQTAKLTSRPAVRQFTAPASPRVVLPSSPAPPRISLPKPSTPAVVKQPHKSTPIPAPRVAPKFTPKSRIPLPNMSVKSPKVPQMSAPKTPTQPRVSVNKVGPSKMFSSPKVTRVSIPAAPTVSRNASAAPSASRIANPAAPGKIFASPKISFTPVQHKGPSKPVMKTPQPQQPENTRLPVLVVYLTSPHPPLDKENFYTPAAAVPSPVSAPSPSGGGTPVSCKGQAGILLRVAGYLMHVGDLRWSFELGTGSPLKLCVAREMFAKMKVFWEVRGTGSNRIYVSTILFT
eukprot:sb/3463366/